MGGGAAPRTSSPQSRCGWLQPHSAATAGAIGSRERGVGTVGLREERGLREGVWEGAGPTTPRHKQKAARSPLEGAAFLPLLPTAQRAPPAHHRLDRLGGCPQGKLTLPRPLLCPEGPPTLGPHTQPTPTQGKGVCGPQGPALPPRWAPARHRLPPVLGGVHPHAAPSSAPTTVHGQRPSRHEVSAQTSVQRETVRVCPWVRKGKPHQRRAEDPGRGEALGAAGASGWSPGIQGFSSQTGVPVGYSSQLTEGNVQATETPLAPSGSASLPPPRKAGARTPHPSRRCAEPGSHLFAGEALPERRPPTPSPRAPE